MKTSTLLSTFAFVASSSALPADIHNRGLPFSLPSFPQFTGFPGLPKLPGFPNHDTPAAAAATPAPAPTTTQAAVATPSPTTSSNSGSTEANVDDNGYDFGNVVGGSTENGIVDGECKELTVIFARGTSEEGNVGTIAGPPMFSALRSSLGEDRVTVQGVDYPASEEGNANMGADGGPTMASLVEQALSQCPSTKIVLSGYSQGGMVVHNAVGREGAPASSITAAVLFGDPMNEEGLGDIPSSMMLELCADGDYVCNGMGGFITEAHLTYGSDAQQAADFIISTAGCL